MAPDPSRPVTAFQDFRRIAAGSLREVAAAARGAGPGVLVFDDVTGHLVDFDPQSLAYEQQAFEASREPGPEQAPEPPPRGRGRPRLGVVAREVTLLPRHWEWLAAQPGGASVALRKLVEQARRDNAGEDAVRQSIEAAYRVMSVLAGDLPRFEAASRALFARDAGAFATELAAWPEDLRSHLTSMAFGPAAPIKSV